MNNLELKIRECKNGNSAKRERRKGLVPGVIYGKVKNNTLFEIGEIDLNREISKTGEHGVVNYNINGINTSGLLKDVQRDPVTHKIIHVDIEEISKNEKIETEVPIQFIGEEYLNNKGQVLQKEKDSVKVKCDANELPKAIKFDVGMGVAGTVYRLSDLEVGAEISIIDDINIVVASISNEKKIISEEMTDGVINKNVDNKDKEAETSK